jgi:hypothetical protein
MYPGTLRNISVVNNTFAFGNPNKSYTFIVMNAALNGVDVRNNVFHQPEGGKTIELGSSLSATNVVVSNNIASGSAMTDRTPLSSMTMTANRTSTDAMLVSPSTGDFHLRSGSPAVDTGLSVAEVERDFDGRPRPQGNGYDVGAYELSSGSAYLLWKLIKGDAALQKTRPPRQASSARRTDSERMSDDPLLRQVAYTLGK